MGRIEILTGRERRRRWSDEEKLLMLAEAEDEGLALAEVARRHDVHPQQLYAWRSMMRKASSPSVPVPTFLPIEIAEPPALEPTPERRRRTKAVEVCPDCGGCDGLKRGEDVTEVLEYVPASFRVIRHVRPRVVCRSCDRAMQAAPPRLPIERGKPGPGLVAHVLAAKYCDHLPLYRQAEIYAREGVDLAQCSRGRSHGRDPACAGGSLPRRPQVRDLDSGHAAAQAAEAGSGGTS